MKRRIRFLLGFLALGFGVYFALAGLIEHNRGEHLLGYVFLLTLAPILLLPGGGDDSL